MRKIWGLFFYYINVLTPRRQLTRALGKLANSKTPWLKNFLIRNFIRSYNLGIHYLSPKYLNSYESFNDFFRRKIDHHIDSNPSRVTSPCEGTISGIYSINTTLSIHQKSFQFHAASTIPTLYAPEPADQVMVIYLAPENYHRVHAPFSGVVHAISYYPGELFSVSPSILNHYPTLLEENERVCITLSTNLGFIHIIMIGALIVGSIKITIQEGDTIQKGAELGWFELGSSVILVLPSEIQLHQRSKMVHVGSQIGIISR